MNITASRNVMFRAIASFLLAFSALMGMHGSASALTTQAAAACKPYGNSNIGGLYTYTSEVYNGSGASLAVGCPVVRTVASPAGGYQVWVDGSGGTGSAYCALYSYNFTGAYMGSISFTATGVFDRLLTLPASQVPTFSSQFVYCYLPAQGAVYDVEPIQ